MDEDELDRIAKEYQAAKKAYWDWFHKTIIGEELEQAREEELLKELETEEKIENKQECEEWLKKHIHSHRANGKEV